LSSEKQGLAYDHRTRSVRRLRPRDLLTPELARTLEALGYGAIWVGGSPGGDLGSIEDLLAATQHITVATGIVNIWKDDARPIASAYHRIAGAHPGRFLLGIGVGHPEATGDRYRRPYEALVSYLDVLDECDVPPLRRVLAALGPKVLGLSAARSAGAHPYLVTPEHTARARETIGPDALLVPEQKVVLERAPGRARELARPAVAKPYLGLVNYTKNLRTLGFTDEDLAGSGSDRLIDALVLHGTVDAIEEGLRAHLDAGADQVAINLITEKGADPAPGFTELAEVLLS
jgi:probable F420-dependent oxidoreductase